MQQERRGRLSREKGKKEKQYHPLGKSECSTDSAKSIRRLWCVIAQQSRREQPWDTHQWELGWVEHSMEASITVSAALGGQKSSNGAYNGPQQRSKGEREMWGLFSCSVISINRIPHSTKILQFSTLQLSGHTGKNSDFPIPSGSYHCTNSIFSVLLSVFQLTTPLAGSPPTGHYGADDNDIWATLPRCLWVLRQHSNHPGPLIASLFTYTYSQGKVHTTHCSTW